MSLEITGFMICVQLLDEHGGSLTGSAVHSGATESVYHASVDDLVDFIQQCPSKEVYVGQLPLLIQLLNSHLCSSLFVILVVLK
jgi:hypothetical protein